MSFVSFFTAFTLSGKNCILPLVILLILSAITSKKGLAELYSRKERFGLAPLAGREESLLNPLLKDIGWFYMPGISYLPTIPQDQLIKVDAQSIGLIPTQPNIIYELNIRASSCSDPHLLSFRLHNLIINTKTSGGKIALPVYLETSDITEPFGLEFTKQLLAEYYKVYGDPAPIETFSVVITIEPEDNYLEKFISTITNTRKTLNEIGILPSEKLSYRDTELYLVIGVRDDPTDGLISKIRTKEILEEIINWLLDPKGNFDIKNGNPEDGFRLVQRWAITPILPSEGAFSDQFPYVSEIFDLSGILTPVGRMYLEYANPPHYPEPSSTSLFIMVYIALSLARDSKFSLNSR